jgi:hypothetical protein
MSDLSSNLLFLGLQGQSSLESWLPSRKIAVQPGSKKVIESLELVRELLLPKSVSPKASFSQFLKAGISEKQQRFI